MSQPVKLSDGLVLDARTVGLAQQRSIAGQVEFWARLGRSVELLLDGKQMLAVSRAAGASSLTHLLDMPGTPEGREIFKTFLNDEAYPHYEACPGRPDLLVRLEKRGSEMMRTVGRFVNREFVEEELAAPEDRMPARSFVPKTVPKRPLKAVSVNLRQKSKAKSGPAPRPAARARTKKHLA